MFSPCCVKIRASDKDLPVIFSLSAIMNIACSTCLESFTEKCEVSSTPCGHVFHTKCIESWFRKDKNTCPQCRKWCTIGQLIKIYFAEFKQKKHTCDAIEADLKCIELMEEKEELEKEIRALKDAKLQFRKMLNWIITNTKVT